VLMLFQSSKLQELQAYLMSMRTMAWPSSFHQLTHVITLSVLQTHCVFLESNSLHAGG